MGEQGVREGAEHAPLWCPSVEDQQSGVVVSYRQEVQHPIAQDGVETQGLKFNDELRGYYDAECGPLVNEQHCIGIILVQMG